MTSINEYEGTVTSRQTFEEVNPQQEPDVIVEEVHHYHHSDDKVGFYSLNKVDRIIWLIAIILETLIGFRVFLKLIAANPESGFASFVYTITAPFLAPFAGLTSTPSASGAVLEISSIIAMVVYALLFWLAAYLIHLIWGR
ncbi:MAG: YggT family protein [Anaerolineae bacterium]|nr:YggT family protein [Anaerolineae bacterium]